MQCSISLTNLTIALDKTKKKKSNSWNGNQIIYFVFYSEKKKKKHFFKTDELVSEKEKYKDIGDDLDVAFIELILKE